MSKNVYVNEDGTVKDVVAIQQQKSADSVAEKYNVDKEQLAALTAEVNENGYVIIPELIPKAMMEEIKQAISPLLTHDGRNEFEGTKTRRIYSVIEKTLALNPLVDHPLIMALMDNFLMDSFLLSQLQAINVYPGEVQQPLHHDDGFYPFPRPRKHFSAATIWAIDDFTEDNGATMVFPKSHLWGDVSPAEMDKSQMIPAVMPAGSVIFFLGTLWHSAGPNHSNAPRMAATAQYCEPWARQQENYGIAISRPQAKLCSDRIQEMLGYSMLFPFIGFVDGRNPKRLLEE